jgi:hypothetical protein
MIDNGDRVPIRVPSGITGLDTILNGGFLKNSVNLIEGTPGAGKTILGPGKVPARTLGARTGPKLI